MVSEHGAEENIWDWWVTPWYRKLHNEVLHKLHSSPNKTRVIKSRRIKHAGHVACMGEMSSFSRPLTIQIISPSISMLHNLNNRNTIPEWPKWISKWLFPRKSSPNSHNTKYFCTLMVTASYSLTCHCRYKEQMMFYRLTVSVFSQGERVSEYGEIHPLETSRVFLMEPAESIQSKLSYAIIKQLICPFMQKAIWKWLSLNRILFLWRYIAIWHMPFHNVPFLLHSLSLTLHKDIISECETVWHNLKGESVYYIILHVNYSVRFDQNLLYNLCLTYIHLHCIYFF
jgi:hypothetical protein